MGLSSVLVSFSSCLLFFSSFVFVPTCMYVVLYARDCSCNMYMYVGRVHIHVYTCIYMYMYSVHVVNLHVVDSLMGNGGGGSGTTLTA